MGLKKKPEGFLGHSLFSKLLRTGKGILTPKVGPGGGGGGKPFCQKEGGGTRFLEKKRR